MFSIKEALKFGWEKVKNDLGFFLALMFVVLLIYFIPATVSFLLTEQGFVWTSLGIDVISFVLTAIVGLGLVRIALNFYKGEESHIETLVSCYHLFPKYFLAFIIYILAVGFGLFLFIIPGIYISLRLWFFDYFLVDEECGAVESLKKSFGATKGNVLKLLLFLLIAGLVNLVGALVLLVGLFVTIPLTILATAFVYKEISGSDNDDHDHDHDDES